MEIRLTSVVRCWSSSSIFTSFSHLMKNFDEFRVLFDGTLTGKLSSGLLVFKRFLCCCFVSISTKTDFIGLTLSSSAFAILLIAFFRTITFKSNGIFCLQPPRWEILVICHHLDFHLSELTIYFGLGLRLSKGAIYHFVASCSYWFWQCFAVCHQDWIHKCFDEKNF